MTDRPTALPMDRPAARRDIGGGHRIRTLREGRRESPRTARRPQPSLRVQLDHPPQERRAGAHVDHNQILWRFGRVLDFLTMTVEV